MPRSSALPLALVALLGAVLGATQLGALDLPLLLANGEYQLDNGSLAPGNVFSWTHPDHGYVYDKWLAALAAAGLHRAGGTTALALLKLWFGAAMGVVLFGIASRRDGSRPWRAAGLAALGLTMVSYRLFLRPEWISFLGLGVTIALLDGILKGRRGPCIAAVAMVPVWAACHSYWFLGPAVVLAAALADRSRPGLVTGALAFAAAAISPHGLANVLHPFRRALTLRGGGLQDAITEMRLPFAGGGPFTFFHGLAIALVLLACLAVFMHLRKREWRHAVVVALVLAVSLSFDRNLAMLGLIVPLSGDLEYTPWAGWFGAVVVCGMGAGIDAFATERRMGTGWHDGRFPFDLMERLPPEAADEHYVNDFSVGSFLAWRRGDAFIDGNTDGYPPAFLASYRRMLVGETGIAEIDDAHPNDGYLLRHNVSTTRMLILGLFVSDDYAPTLWDDVATLFRRVDDPEQAERGWSEWLHGAYLAEARTYFETPERALELAGSSYRPGTAGAMAARLRRALESSPYHARFYEDLASSYEADGDLTRAAWCTRLALRLRAP